MNVIDNLVYEREYLSKGVKLIAGVDEVGRGPLAGPVVTAAVIMPLGENDVIEGVTDSKALSAKKREELNKLILERAVAVKISLADNDVIDEINVLEATKRCMRDCVMGLDPQPDAVFIDAVKLKLPMPTVSIIKGDLLSYSIGAASIVAKVYRDELMKKYHEKYPAYGFFNNKGYGTKSHIEALKEVGPCPIHRKTFIKNFWE